MSQKLHSHGLTLAAPTTISGFLRFHTLRCVKMPLILCYPRKLIEGSYAGPLDQTSYEYNHCQLRVNRPAPYQKPRGIPSRTAFLAAYPETNPARIPLARLLQRSCWIFESVVVELAHDLGLGFSHFDVSVFRGWLRFHSESVPLAGRV